VFLWGPIGEVNAGAGIPPRNFSNGVRPHVAETELPPPPQDTEMYSNNILKSWLTKTLRT